MASTKRGKGAKRSGGKAAVKDLRVRARKAKAVRGGLLPARQSAQNYEGPSTLIAQKVQKVYPSS
jgi:hypothetical protein